MRYTVNIKRLLDGKVFTIEKDWHNNDIANLCYQWTDGNDGCDCNRLSYIENTEHNPCGDMEKCIAWIEVNGKIVMDERPLSRDSQRDLAVHIVDAMEERKEV